MGHTTTLTPNATDTDVFYLGVPNDPDLHLNLDGMTWDTDFDEDEFCRSQGSLALLKVSLINPHPDKRWSRFTFRIAWARLTGGAGNQKIKMTLYISGSPEESTVFATTSFTVVGQTFSFNVDYTSSQLDTAKLEVDVSGSYLGDFVITGIELQLDAEVFSADADGGGLLGGLAEIHMPVSSHTGIGGAIAGGSADPDFYDIVEVGGGALAGGLGIFHLVTDKTGSGGLLAGGLADHNRDLNPAATGGAIGGGLAVITSHEKRIATGGAIAGGSADPDFFDVVEVGGGALAGGVSVVTQVFNPEALGGVLAGGVAEEERILTVEGTGGALAGGIADPDFIDIIEVGGGALTGGLATISLIDIVEVGGGVLVTGEAKISPFDEEGTGGALAGGIAKITPFNEQGTGGALTGILSFNEFSEVGAGGAIAGGAAKITMPVTNHQGIGGALLGGLAPVISFLPFNMLDDRCPCNTITETPLGGALVGGANADVSGGTIIGTGGCLCGGTAFIDKLADPWDGAEAIYGLYQESDGAPGDYIDESSHNLHGTGVSDPAIDDGIFCLNSQLFVEENYITMPRDSISADQAFTVSCFARLEDFGQDRSFFTMGDDEDDWKFTMGYSFANSIRALIQTTDGTNNSEWMAWSPVFLDMSKWYHFSCVWRPANSLTVYINGELQATATVTDRTTLAGGSLNKIGSFREAGFPLANIQDLRLFPEAKSAEWLKAEHDNICDPNFFSWGEVETLGAEIS